MARRWAYFTIGGMAGVIAVLGFALVSQARPAAAWASPPRPQGADGDPRAGILLGTGGSQQNLNDIAWVLYKRKNPDYKAADPKDGTKAENVLNKPEILTLACYQVARNGQVLRLVGVRNVTYDMEVLELKNEKPHVPEIVKALRDEQRKKDKKDKDKKK